MNNIVTFRGKSRVRLFTLNTMRNLFIPLNNSVSLSEVYKRTRFYTADLRLYVNGTEYNLTNYGGVNFLKSIRITRRKNEMTTWTMELADTKDRLLSPENESSSLYSLIDIDSYKSSGSYERTITDYSTTPPTTTTFTTSTNNVLNKYLILKIKHEDSVWTSGKLLIDDCDYSSDDRTLNLSGSDLCSQLYTPLENMTPWKDTKAKKIIKDILVNFHITKCILDFDDYYVKKYDFVESTGIDKIKELVEVGMGTWIFDRDTFIIKRDPSLNSTPSWIFRDFFNIFSLNHKRSKQGYYNDISMGRKNPNNGVCLIEGKEWGFHKENLCTPLVNPQVYVQEAKRGEVVLIFTGNDSMGVAQHDDYPIGNGLVDYYNPPLHWGYPGAATWISFSYKPEEGITNDQVTDTSSGYKILVMGQKPDLTTENTLEDDPDYNYHYINSTEAGKHGVIKYPSYLDTHLIPNTTHAEKLTKWILKHCIRERNKITKKAPLNFFAYPGDVIKIDKDYGTGIDSKLYYANEVSIDFSLNEVSNVYNCSRIFE